MVASRTSNLKICNHCFNYEHMHGKLERCGESKPKANESEQAVEETNNINTGQDQTPAQNPRTTDHSTKTNDERNENFIKVQPLQHEHQESRKNEV